MFLFHLIFAQLIGENACCLKMTRYYMERGDSCIKFVESGVTVTSDINVILALEVSFGRLINCT